MNGPSYDSNLEEVFLERLAKDDEDAFDYHRSAQNLAITLDSATPPFVFAICGGWGSGKSTLLRYLLQYLTPRENLGVVLYFNALRSGTQNDVLSSFVSSISQQLRRIPATKKLLSKGKKARKALLILVQSAVEAFTDLNPVTKVSGSIFKKAWASSEAASGLASSAEEKVRENFHKVSLELHKRNIRPFVIIDELDRCAPPAVVRLLEGLRLFFCGEDELRLAVGSYNGMQLNSGPVPFRYILAIDEEYVARAFSQRYGLSLSEAFTYTSKFIQYRYHFPPKNWEGFIKKVIGRFSENKGWFPNGSTEELALVASIMGAARPREVQRMLVYLLVWQKMYYSSTGPCDAVGEILERKVLQHDEVRSAFLRVINVHLFLFAAVKVLFPAQVELVLRKNLYLWFPKGESELNDVISLLQPTQPSSEEFPLELTEGFLDLGQHDSVSLGEWQRESLKCLVLMRACYKKTEDIRWGVSDAVAAAKGHEDIARLEPHLQDVVRRGREHDFDDLVSQGLKQIFNM